MLLLIYWTKQDAGKPPPPAHAPASFDYTAYTVTNTILMETRLEMNVNNSVITVC